MMGCPPCRKSIVIQKPTPEEAPLVINNQQASFRFQFHSVLHNASQ